MGEWKPEEWARWRGLLSEQQVSGQSVAGFCRERALLVWQFYEWRKRPGWPVILAQSENTWIRSPDFRFTSLMNWTIGHAVLLLSRINAGITLHFSPGAWVGKLILAKRPCALEQRTCCVKRTDKCV
jgi:hypothetical protein